MRITLWNTKKIYYKWKYKYMCVCKHLDMASFLNSANKIIEHREIIKYKFNYCLSKTVINTLVQ